MNVMQTQYDVIKKVGKRVCNYQLKFYREDHDGAVRKGEGGQKLNPNWDLSWHDLSITPDFLAKMMPW